MNKNRPAPRRTSSSGSSSRPSGGGGVHKTGGGRSGSTGSHRPVGSGGFFSGGGGSGGSSHSSHSSSGSHGSGSSHSGGGGAHGNGSYSSGSGGGSYSGGSGGFRAATRSKPGCLVIIVVILAMIFGGGGLALNGLGGDSYQDLVQAGGGSYSGWYLDGSSSGNTGVLNTEVSPDARAKFTQIRGDGKDTNTIMVYMCGTDLESQSGMATSDLNEMLSASVGKSMNLIVYTGGCKKWRNNTVSSSHNQIWQIRNGDIKCLVKNAGTDSMTKAATLSSFIKWTADKFPANRMSLIFWDHGGGSVTGYGYDEKHPKSGSMTLASINSALRDAGIKYDFIGFDACLMATAETALMAGSYADYLIGSEETEPGIGWYYTNWLTSLNKDPSLDTLQIGKQIADDFTKECAKRCPGQSTTLSLTDLSELTQTLPPALNAFAEDASGRIGSNGYQQVSTARSGSKEFARNSGIDQVDLTHFASLMDTRQGKGLAGVLTEAVKYNRTASNTVNAYGLSIYFPYKKLSQVDSMTSTYEQIGMDDDYTACIRQFAQMQVCGQAVAGGTGNPFDAVLGGGNSASGYDVTGQAMQQLIGSLLSGSFSDYKSLYIADLDEDNTEFMRRDLLDPDAVSDYIASNRVTSDDLVWAENKDGDPAIMLSDDQWNTVSNIDLNMFFDDGDGYLEMGLDNLYDWDSDDNLIPAMDHTWVYIEGQPVAYYHTETVEFDDGAKTITGYVPVDVNGDEGRLILTYEVTGEGEDGYWTIAGLTYDYEEDVTSTIAKSLPGLEKGDQVKFLCDYYSHEGQFEDYYQIGRTWTVKDPEGVSITEEVLGDEGPMILYKFTDIYGEEYWTPVLDW